MYPKRAYMKPKYNIIDIPRLELLSAKSVLSDNMIHCQNFNTVVLVNCPQKVRHEIFWGSLHYAEISDI